MKKFRLILPLVIFLLIAGLLFRGLKLHPDRIPSPLIGKSVPDFSLPTLNNANQMITQTIFAGHVTLLNVWASWCEACRYEHPYLIQIAEDPQLTLIGLNYRDETDHANEWLKQMGNPYKTVLVDESGTAAIDWGIYGTPETFVIDKKSHIRYRQIGAIDETAWRTVLKPLVEKLESE
ncbi:MAG: DsbE family thiol:disulfide interchange protein [Gammaproteobacteria bacterium]|nr:DsbE family thiol:disulfide interchange protein [Gammaproteobacteria bacterium]